MRLPIAWLSAFFVLSFLADDGAGALRSMTGSVAEWRAGQSISVVNEQTDPGGVQFALRDTSYQGNARTIKPGVPVTVWYRFVGERRPIAVRLRVPATNNVIP
jgi:hypothetical protein